MVRTGLVKKAFTLIELMVVVGIIAILAAILLPALNAASKKADITRAKAEVKGLHAAWMAYFNEYGCWPIANYIFLDQSQPSSIRQNAGERSMPSESTGVVMVVSVMTNIMYPNSGVARMNQSFACTNYNPKRVTFFSYKASSVNAAGDMVDPWGCSYKVMFDINRDGCVARPALGSLPATNVNDSVIVWSTGPDCKESVDDINSWQ